MQAGSWRLIFQTRIISWLRKISMMWQGKMAGGMAIKMILCFVMPMPRKAGHHLHHEEGNGVSLTWLHPPLNLIPMLKTIPFLLNPTNRLRWINWWRYLRIIMREPIIILLETSLPPMMKERWLFHRWPTLSCPMI